MIRRPPRSTLFHTRRSSDLTRAFGEVARMRRSALDFVGGAQSMSFAQLSAVLAAATARQGRRSEEHTSELQSHSDLVCRLLLENKKKKKTRKNNIKHTYK